MTGLRTAILTALDDKHEDAYWLYRGTVEALLDLHKPDDCGDCSACTCWEDDMVAHTVESPCPTVRAIAEKLGISLTG